MRNFLLVDDDYVCTFLNNKALERLGCANEIRTASNGQHAINILSEQFENAQPMPDVILLDLNMPVMDGFDFLESFKRLDIPNIEDTKIIIVTSSVNDNDIAKVKAMGVNHYLTKPISEEMLREALED